MAKKKNIKFTPAHEVFCQHYAEHGNATMAYLQSHPNVKYNTAKADGPKLTAIPSIQERIEQIKEEFALSVQQSKEKTIQALIQSGEEAKLAGQFSAYAKLRDMVIKMCGFYEPDRVDITSAGERITINLDLSSNKDKKDNGDKPNINE